MWGGGGGGNPGPPELPSGFSMPSAFQETSPGSGSFTGGIYAYQFDPSSGGITAVAGSPFATDTIGAPVASAAMGDFCIRSISQRRVYSRLQHRVDGSLARVPGAPFVTTEPTRWLVTDPAADFLFAIAYSGDLTVYAIDSSTGALTAQSGVAALGSPLVITPDGQRLYQISPSRFFEFSIDPATGALKPLAGSPVAIQTNTFGPGDAAIDPSGRFIYVTNLSVFTGFGGPMYAWSIDPQTGAVSPIPPFSPTAGPQASVAVDASGKYAIVTTVVTSKTGPNCLAVLGIDPTTGMLSQVPGSPFVGDCGVLVADSSSLISMTDRAASPCICSTRRPASRDPWSTPHSGHGGFESRSDPLTEVGPVRAEYRGGQGRNRTTTRGFSVRHILHPASPRASNTTS